MSEVSDTSSQSETCVLYRFTDRYRSIHTSFINDLSR